MMLLAVIPLLCSILSACQTDTVYVLIQGRITPPELIERSDPTPKRLLFVRCVPFTRRVWTQVPLSLAQVQRRARGMPLQQSSTAKAPEVECFTATFDIDPGSQQPKIVQLPLVLQAKLE